MDTGRSAVETLMSEIQDSGLGLSRSGDSGSPVSCILHLASCDSYL